MTDIVNIGFAADSSQVRTAKQDLDKLADSGNKVQSATDAFQASWASLTGAFAAGQAIYSAVTGVFNTLINAISGSAMAAARFETMGVVMTRVAENAGYTGGQMLQLQHELEKTGIASLEACESLTKLVQAHIDLGMASKLARVAQDAAVIGNINSSEAFMRLVYGIQAAQSETLRSIGINVNFQQSYQKLADQLGVTVDSLSEQEKTQARANAVLERGADIAGVYEDAMGTAGKQILSLKRYQDNLNVALGEAFQDALILGVATYTGHLKAANASALDNAEAIKEFGKSARTGFAMVIDAGGGVVAMLSNLWHMSNALAELERGNLAGAASEYAAAKEAVMSLGAAKRLAAEQAETAAQKENQAWLDNKKATIEYTKAVNFVMEAYKGTNVTAEQLQTVMVRLTAFHFPTAEVGLAPLAFRDAAAAAETARATMEKLSDTTSKNDKKFAEVSTSIRNAGKELGWTDEEIQRSIDKQEKQIYGHEREAAARKDATEAQKRHREMMQEFNKEADIELANGRAREQQFAKYLTQLETGKITQEEYAEKMAKVAGMSKQEIVNLEAEEARTQAVNKAKSDYLKELMAAEEPHQKFIKSLEDEVAQLELEVKMFGKTAEESKLYQLELKKTEILTGDMTESEKEYALGLVAVAEGYVRARQEQQMYAELMSSVWSAGTGFIKDFLANGTSAFKRLWDNFKNWAFDAFAQIAAKKILVSVVGAMGLGDSAVAAANAVGGQQLTNTTNLLSAGSNLLGLTGESGGFLSMASEAMGLGSLPSLMTAFGNIGTIIPTFTAALETGATILEAGALAFEGMAASFVPVVGWVVAAGLLAWQIWGKKGGGPKEGGSGWTGDKSTNLGFGAGSRLIDSSQTQQDKEMQQWVEAMQGSYNKVYAALGGKAKSRADFGVGISADPKGTASTFLMGTARLNGQEVYRYQHGDNGLGRDPAVVQAQMQLEGQRSLLAALQHSDLPAEISRMLNSINVATASGGQIERVIAYAQALNAVNEAISGAENLSDQIDALAANPQLAANSFEMLGNALDSLVTNFDGSTEQTQTLVGATAAYYDSLVKLVAQIKDVQRATSEMFGSSRESINLSSRDNSWLQAYYASQQANAEAMIGSLADPESIQKQAKVINDAIMAQWNLLTPQEQNDQRQQYLDMIDAANVKVDSRLTTIMNAATETAKTELQKAHDVLIAAADKLNDAANTNLQASTNNMTASQTPVKVDVHVDVDVDASGIGSGEVQFSGDSGNQGGG